jgi:hypothetical protein
MEAKYMETKRDKFVRLAEKRMENVLKGISLLGNLANCSNYDYTEADAAKIIKTLKTAISDLERTYNSSQKNTKFKL